MQKNDWGVEYTAIRFMENALSSHSKVAESTRTRDILFSLTLTGGEKFDVLLVREYCLGLAAVHRAQSEFPSAEYIVTCANWNGYTREAKEYGNENDIGIFNAGEFFGALNWSNPKKYYRRDHEGNPICAYKVA